MNSLLDFLFGFAQQELERRGEYYPFAAAIGSSGEPEAVAVHLGEEHPQADEVIDNRHAELLRKLSGQRLHRFLSASGFPPGR